MSKEKIHDHEGRELALREFDYAEMCGDKPPSKRLTLAQEVLYLKSRVSVLERERRTHWRVITGLIAFIAVYVALK